MTGVRPALQACHAITAAAAAASEMQRAHLQAVQLCLARLGKVLQALGACVGLADVAPVFQDAFWSGAVLPLADSLLYCRRQANNSGTAVSLLCL